LKRIAHISPGYCPVSKDSFSSVQDSIGLDSLSVRRDLLDTVFVCDVLNNVVDCPEILHLNGFRISGRFTRNSHSFNVGT